MMLWPASVGGEHEAQARQHRPQVEHAQDHDDQRHDDREPQDLGEQVFERGDPAIRLLEQGGVVGELGLLGVHRPHQDLGGWRARPPVDQEQDDDGDQERQRVLGEPRRDALRIDRGEGHGAIIPR